MGTGLLPSKRRRIPVLHRLRSGAREPAYPALPVLLPPARRDYLVEAMAAVGDRAVRRHPDARARADRHRVLTSRRAAVLRRAGPVVTMDCHGAVRPVLQPARAVVVDTGLLVPAGARAIHVPGGLRLRLPGGIRPASPESTPRARCRRAGRRRAGRCTARGSSGVVAHLA